MSISPLTVVYWILCVPLLPGDRDYAEQCLFLFCFRIGRAAKHKKDCFGTSVNVDDVFFYFFFIHGTAMLCECVCVCIYMYIYSKMIQ